MIIRKHPVYISQLTLVYIQSIENGTTLPDGVFRSIHPSIHTTEYNISMGVPLSLLTLKLFPSNKHMLAGSKAFFSFLSPN